MKNKSAIAAVSALVLLVGVTSSMADVNVTFGSDNDGYAGFTTSPITFDTGIPPQPYNSWTELADGVQFTEGITTNDTNGSLENNSLLHVFGLDRSVGQSYTVTGTMTWSFEADRNNRQGIYLFGNGPVVDDEDVLGAISLQYQADAGVMRLSEGLDQNAAAFANIDLVPANAIGGGSGYYTDVPFIFQADFSFIDDGGTNTQIDLTYTMIDQFAGAGIFATNTLNTVLNADDFTGNYFGFAGRTRNDGAGDSIATYQTFSIPEPGTLSLVALMGGGILFFRRRFGKK